MEEKQFFMKNGLRNVFINDGSFMNIHDFNLIYVCSVKFLAYNKLIATIRELLKKKYSPCSRSVYAKHYFKKYVQCYERKNLMIYTQFLIKDNTIEPLCKTNWSIF